MSIKAVVGARDGEAATTGRGHPAAGTWSEAHGVLFHALSDPTRLAALGHLASGEHRVRDLVEHMHLAQSTVSVHLACLRDAGLVQVRGEGRASWCRLSDPGALDALATAADAALAATGGVPTRSAHERSDAQADASSDGGAS